MVQEAGQSLSHGALLSWSNFGRDGRLQPQPQARCNELRDLSSSLSTSSTHSSPSDPKEGAWPVARVYLRTNDAATGDMTSLCGSDRVLEIVLQGSGVGGGATASPALEATPTLGLWGKEGALFNCLLITTSSLCSL